LDLPEDSHTALTSAQLAHDTGDERIEVIADINSLIVWRAAPDGSPLQSCAVSDLLDDAPAQASPHRPAHHSETWLEAVHPDDRERVRPVWREAIRSGSVFQAFYRLRQPDGSFRWSHGCGVPLLDERGRIREWIGTIADIEDKIAAQQSRSDARIRLAVEANRIGTFDLDLVSGEIWCSDVMADLMGHHPNRPLTREQARALVHPDDRTLLAERAGAAITREGGGAFACEIRLIRPDSGAVLWVECTAHAMPDAAGKPVRVLGTARDVTARHAPP
jgi:PAS domain S-box-containing protein